MQPEQISLMPAQYATKIIASSLRGVVPMIIGTAGLLVAGTLYGGYKGIKTASDSVSKAKAGENKASKIHKIGEPIKSFTIDNEIYNEFARQATEQGIPFSACYGESTTNVIATANNRPLIMELLKSINETREKDAIQNGEVVKQVKPTEVEDFEKSDIYTHITKALDDVISNVKEDLIALEKKGDGYEITVDPKKEKAFLSKIESLKEDFTKMQNPPKEVGFSKSQANETQKLFAEIMRREKENLIESRKNFGLDQNPKNLSLMALDAANKILKDQGINVKGEIVEGNLKLKIEGEHMPKFMNYARKFNETSKENAFNKGQEKENSVDKKETAPKIDIGNR